MKPSHIGLLVLGAAVAGALAVKMTQPIPLPLTPVPPAGQPGKTAPVLQSPVPPPPKQLPLVAATPAPAPPQAAPAPVYDKETKRSTARNKPFIAKVKPTQWLPQPYVSRATPETAAPVTPERPSDPDPPSATVEQARIPEPPPEPVAEPPAPRQVTLRKGMTIPVRLTESLSSERVMTGDTFWGSLAEPLVVDGLVIAERGARISGRIVDSQRAGRISGAAILTLSLATLMTSDGQRVTLSTDPWTKQADSSRANDAATIGGGAALGAIIGAIAGGGKGAAIGAGIGGGAGTGAVMATRGKPAAVPSETVIPFRLASRVTLTEQIAAR